MSDETPMREILRAVDASIAETNAQASEKIVYVTTSDHPPDKYGIKGATQPRPDPDYIYGIVARIVRLNFSEITEELGNPLCKMVNDNPPKNGDELARILFNFSKDWLERNSAQ